MINASVIETGSDQEFNLRGAQMMEMVIRKSIEERGRAVVGLSGGSTPRAIYGALGEAKSIDWSKVWIFLVDDRHCREDSPHSNQFLLRSTLLRNAPIPDSQLVFPDTELPVEECIKLYNQYLTDLFKKGPADLITLGLGDDGHIASLFPPLSNEAFGKNIAIHTTTKKFDIKDRISVTMPSLVAARQKIFFLKGKLKKETWEAMTASTEGEKRWPAKAIVESGNTAVIAQW